MNGREWVKVTGGFPRRALVLIIWERAVALFFFLKQTFLHIRPLEKNYSAYSTYFPSCLKAQTLNLYYYYYYYF